NMGRYRKAAQKMFGRLYDITDLVEPISVDGGDSDVTDYAGNPVRLAETLQHDILTQLDLPRSIGIGHSQFLANPASARKKPLGITILTIREIKDLLWPLDVGQMQGVGKKTVEKLNEININTIGDLANSDSYDLRQLLGINGERLRNRANGI